jgi:hypothetical protein
MAERDQHCITLPGGGTKGAKGSSCITSAIATARPLVHMVRYRVLKPALLRADCGLTSEILLELRPGELLDGLELRMVSHQRASLCCRTRVRTTDGWASQTEAD